MNKFIQGLSVSVCLTTATSSLFAATFIGPIPYLSAADSPFAPFSNPNFSYFYLEDFEDGLLNTPGVAATTGGRVISPSNFTDSVDADDSSIIDGGGTLGHSWFSTDSTGSTSIFTFVFDAAQLGGLPTHAGIVWTDVGETSIPQPSGTTFVIFEAFDSNGNSLGTINPINPLGDGKAEGGTAAERGTAAGATDEDRFFGVSNPGGISKITVSVSDSDDWEADHLQYGRFIPEPSVAILLGSGILGLVNLRRRSQGL